MRAVINGTMFNDDSPVELIQAINIVLNYYTSDRMVIELDISFLEDSLDQLVLKGILNYVGRAKITNKKTYIITIISINIIRL